jgi:hypothetical protein
VIGAVKRAYDALTGGGEFSVTVPPMDGALNPNNRLEEADLVAAAQTPDNVCAAGGRILFSSGKDVLALEPSGSAAAAPYASFDRRIDSLAAYEDSVAIGLADGKVTIRGGSHDGLALTTAEGRPLRCATALAFAGPDHLIVCIGSQDHSAEDWKYDLMALGASGSVWRFDLRSGRADLIADRLAFPFGVLPLAGDTMLVAESWRHRLIKFAPGRPPEAVLSDLPAYPARITPAADARGAWLALFAPRRQLTEFVLREPGYRKRMMAEIAPDYWVGPTLAPMKSFLEPLQGGTLKKLAAIKPWAPSRSYGLVVRLDENHRPLFSYHSRADGSRHGVMSAIEVGGRLYASSHGANAIVAVKPSAED